MQDSRLDGIIQGLAASIKPDIKIAWHIGRLGSSVVAVHPVDDNGGDINHSYTVKIQGAATVEQDSIIPHRYEVRDAAGNLLAILWNAREARPNEDLH